MPEVTAEQQRELDAWIASNEQCIETVVYSEDYSVGYNAGAAAAAEAIRQGNWSWEDYQQWKERHANTPA